MSVPPDLEYVKKEMIVCTGENGLGFEIMYWFKVIFCVSPIKSGCIIMLLFCIIRYQFFETICYCENL